MRAFEWKSGRGWWREVGGRKTLSLGGDLRTLFFKPRKPPVMDFAPIVVKQHAAPASRKTPESRYWRRFKHPVFVKEYAPVTAVHFSPAKPHRYAVTAGTRVQIYAPRTQKVAKTISRFKDVARSANIRYDGKLIVAADDTGLVQVRNPTASSPTPLSLQTHRSLTSTVALYCAH